MTRRTTTTPMCFTPRDLAFALAMEAAHREVLFGPE
jgi:hypothetical protein